MSHSIKNDVVVIVLGKNYSTSLSVIRALGQEGYKIELFYITTRKGGSKIAAASKYLQRTIEHKGRHDNEIIERLLNTYNKPSTKYILMPTDDYSASLLDYNRELLQDSFYMPHIKKNTYDGISVLMQKNTQAHLAKQYGLNVATYWEIPIPVKEEIEIPDEIPYPCFLKPLMSAKGFKNEICKCDSKEELVHRLYKMQKVMAPRTVMVQEYLDITEEYAISGACIDQDIVMPALNKKIVTGIHDRGVTVIGQISDFSDILSIKDNIILLLKSLHYTGLFDIDLIRVEDKLYFGEINFRSSGIGYSVIKAGVNLPAIIVSALLGENWKKYNTLPQYNLRFFYEKTGWEDVIFNYRTRREIEDYQDLSDFGLLDVKEDPIPGQIFMSEVNKSIRLEKIERIVPVQKVLTHVKKNIKKIFLKKRAF